MPHSILVTGATGKTGRRLLPMLRAQGADVRAASRSRHDGTIITRDCPVGLARMRRAAWWTLSKVAAAMAMIVGGAAWAVNYANPYRDQARLASIQPLNALTRWLAEPAPIPVGGQVVLGGMCATPPPAPLPPADAVTSETLTP